MNISARKIFKNEVVVFSIVIAATLSLYFFDEKKNQHETHSSNEIVVIDGDTLKIGDKKIRLYGIDCPEKNQNYGNKAKNITTDYIKNAPKITLYAVGTDKYSRTVSIVKLDEETTLQEELVKSGAAWVYKEYCQKPICVKLVKQEVVARQNKLGLWNNGDATPPWIWRRTR